MRSRVSASPPMRSTRIRRASRARRISPRRAAPINGCRTRSSCSPMATVRRSSSSIRGSNCSRIRCSASRPRAGSSLCRAARRRSISPMRCIRASAIPRSARRSTAASRRFCRNCRMATRLRSSAPRAMSPPAAWESLVVTGKARSAIRRATREAVRMQYAGLGRQIVTRAFERAGRPSRTRS